MNRQYQIRKLLRKPIAWYRRKKETEATGFWRAALELHSYSKALYDYADHKIEKPDMMYDLKVDEQSVFLDLGAYIGEWTDNILTKGNPKAVHLYEPHPGLAKALREKYKGKDNIHIHECGLSDSYYDTTFYFADQGSSEYREDNEQNFQGKPVSVQMKDAYLEIKDMPQISCIKINIEGGEYPVLDRLIENNALSKFDTVMVQFHEWIPKSYQNRNKIRRALRKTHNCEWSYFFVWEKWTLK